MAAGYGAGKIPGAVAKPQRKRIFFRWITSRQLGQDLCSCKFRPSFGVTSKFVNAETIRNYGGTSWPMMNSLIIQTWVSPLGRPQLCACLCAFSLVCALLVCLSFLLFFLPLFFFGLYFYERFQTSHRTFQFVH